MNRRRFVFWISLGIFGLAEKLRADALDELAATILRRTEPKPATVPDASPEHWTFASNNSWHWYERENFVDGRWKPTGITTPINNRTGEPYTGRSGYLDESLVPAELRVATKKMAAVWSKTPVRSLLLANRTRPVAPTRASAEQMAAEPARRRDPHLAPDHRRAGSGRERDDFLEHLTRDHSFKYANVVELTIDEQAKLHAAAHEGY